MVRFGFEIASIFSPCHKNHCNHKWSSPIKYYFISVALPTIKNTNTKSFTDLQISRQTNSSGILSDQNLSGGASGNRLQNQSENHYEVIDDIIRRNVIHQDDSSDSGTYLSFTEEVRLRNGYPKLIPSPLLLALK